MPRLLVTHSGSHGRPLGLVREAFDDFEVRNCEVPAGDLNVEATDRLRMALEGCEACLLRPGRLTRDVFEAADDLRVVALTGSGVDHIDLGAATDHGVVVANSPGGPAPSVVEHTFAMAFALLRNLPERSHLVWADEWERARPAVTKLCGKTLGVVGLGIIGLAVADTAADRFGVDIAGYDPYVSEERDHPVFPRYGRERIEAAGVELIARRELFERASIVSTHTADRRDGRTGRRGRTRGPRRGLPHQHGPRRPH